jgi:hypothetical protein
MAIMGCSEDPLSGTGGYDPSEIVVFSTDAITRGTPVEDEALLADIGTFGYHTGQNGWTTDDLPNRMFNQRLYRDAEGAWQYDGEPVAWNGVSAADLFTFFAYAPFATADNGIVVNGNDSTTGIPELTYTVPEDVTLQPDLMAAVPRMDIIRPASGYVSLVMEHALTTIGFQVAGNGERITGISISGVSMTGTLRTDGGDIAWNNLGEPSATDFSASINFDSGENYYTATPTMSTHFMKGNGYLMMIPQTLGENAVLTVTYDDDTTYEINLDTHVWQPGKKITYELTILPDGVIAVEPAFLTMPNKPAGKEIVVDCSGGQSSHLLKWTLTASEPWLMLSFDPSGTGAGQTLSGMGTQTVYVFTTLNNSGATRTATVTLDDETDVVVTVKQEFCTAQRFARSNIVMYIDRGGNKILTLAETEADHTTPKSITYYDESIQMTVTGTVPAIPANVQGLHFRWGSLVGITSDGTYGTPFDNSTTGVAPAHVVFWPAEYTPQVPASWLYDASGMRTANQIPYIDYTMLEQNPDQGSAGYGLDAYKGYPDGTGQGFDKANALGDICRYISDMGWTDNKWRIPTAAELLELYNETTNSNNGGVVGTWDTLYETITGTGESDVIFIGHKYGYYPIKDVRVVGAGATGRETSSSISNPGDAKVVLPAAGSRAMTGWLFSPGYYAYYWSSTNSYAWGSSYTTYYYGPTGSAPNGDQYRMNGFSVRCIRADQ